mmetsp:Transcript_20679/g.29081  ORF Transcript_20679/g.29081 Transcript_20679/m.29081 type:complete len:134 (+) Transcript_20679:93-494(+)|eukprot:CAMPEP_0175093548 /NCGR_PEP_ID=MMETSP0086_2-20121207/3082_1 /TAXON_ID=136419 /ORGANISM="Unknown Unknown, Strain D1" /LENGTH=133 /DNA_ID=CAMNT_0016366539 /DNA_START=79 /DNA_END=480 /DNA_ORIENTATION=-
MFAKVAHSLDRQFGEQVDINGGLYLPDAHILYIAQALSLCFYIGLFLVFLGGPLFRALNFKKGEELVEKMQENQGATIIGLMMCNMIAGNMLSSGAFEVYFNGQLVHSKLQTGQLPDLNRLQNMASGFLSRAA